MLTAIKANEPVTLPPHPDGPGGWAYALIDNEGQVVFADDAGELVALFIEGYRFPRDDRGHDLALAARSEALVEVAERSQRYLVDEAVEGGVLDPLAAGEDALTALFAPRTRPWEGRSTEDGTASYEWDGPVPLILLATDYAPFTDRPQPTGNVVYLDPSTEVSFLVSLDTLGLVKFLVAGGR